MSTRFGGKMTKAYDAIFITYNDNKLDPVLKHSRKCQEALTQNLKLLMKL